MKNILKIAVFAAALILLAFAACNAELETRFEESWKEDIHAAQDVTRNTGLYSTGWLPWVEAYNSDDDDVYGNEYGGSLGAAIAKNDTDFGGGNDATKGNNKLLVYLDYTADVFKGTTSGDALVTKIKEFLKFYTYPKALSELQFAQDSISAGWTLTELDYKFVKREGSNVIIELERPLTKNDSDIVVKVIGSKYTYNNGLTVDVDENGIPGEEGYDDYCYWLYVTDIIRPATYQYFVAPESLGLEVQLQGIGSQSTGDGDSSTPKNIILSDTDWYYSWYQPLQLLGDANYNATLVDNDLKQQEMYEKFIKAFAGCFSIERFNPTTNKWELHAAGEFNDTKPTEAGIFGYKQIVAKNVSFNHGVAYRTKFDLGSASLVTADKIMGLNQRIRVTGGSGAYITERNQKKIKVTDPEIMWINNNTNKPPIDANVVFTNAVIFHDFDNTNVTLKVKMTSGYSTFTPGTTTPLLQGTDNYYYFKDNKEEFLKNFKIYKGTGSFIYSTNLMEVKISDVKFVKEELENRAATDSVTGINHVGYNVVEIKLDPSYKLNTPTGASRYFYFGPGLVFDTTTVRMRGTGDIWEREGWTYITASGTW